MKETILGLHWFCPKLSCSAKRNYNNVALSYLKDRNPSAKIPMVICTCNNACMLPYSRRGFRFVAVTSPRGSAILRKIPANLQRRSSFFCIHPIDFGMNVGFVYIMFLYQCLESHRRNESTIALKSTEETCKNKNFKKIFPLRPCFFNLTSFPKAASEAALTVRLHDDSPIDFFVRSPGLYLTCFFFWNRIK